VHVGVLLLKGFEFTDRMVKEKKWYEYRVLAENEGGLSAPSSQSTPVKAKPFKGQSVSVSSFNCRTGYLPLYGIVTILSVSLMSVCLCMLNLPE